MPDIDHEIARPFDQWLRDNDIDPNSVIMWPDLEIDPERGVIRIESLMEPLTIVCDRSCTQMREYHLKQPMSEEFAEIWKRTSTHAQAERRLSALMSMAAQHRATVVTTAPGDRLLLALAQPVAPDSEEYRQLTIDMQDTMRTLFPGIDVVLLFGVHAIAVDRPVGDTSAIDRELSAVR